MRRRDREVTDRAWIDKVVQEAEYITLALSAPGGSPYAVPVNHVFDGENLYFHCAKEGLKLDCIKNSPCVAFNALSQAEYYQNPEKRVYTTHYKSVSGRGTAEILTDTAEKIKALELVRDKFIRGAYTVNETIADSVCIVKIHIEEIYGKKNDTM
ncbi:MAG: pyridoxamine 5'-phosphate oxidase family protein [Synergistaceae bacterium]|nr:pyridoxamine 5'-phosphate oxidase family protein [Synergistaceae bacterium]